MIQPEAGASVDEVLEYAAQLIEEESFADLAGIFAKRKRAREDADLRYRTIQQTRADCARHIRAMKSRRDLDALAVLRRIAELKDDYRHDMHLRDAWPLAWKGWVDITATLRCNSNSVPPEVEYRIRLTDEGREVLATDPVREMRT